MVRSAYTFVARPADAGHDHPVLIFDGADQPHLPLTTFAREATRRLAASSVRVYLYALLPFFTFLDSTGSGGEQNSWTGDFHGVRHTVAEYLEEQLGCSVWRHHLGFELVSVT